MRRSCIAQRGEGCDLSYVKRAAGVLGESMIKMMLLCALVPLSVVYVIEMAESKRR